MDRWRDGKRMLSDYNHNEIVDGSPNHQKKKKKKITDGFSIPKEKKARLPNQKKKKIMDGFSIPKEKKVCVIIYDIDKFKVYIADVDWEKSYSSSKSNSDENDVFDLDRVRRFNVPAAELKDFKWKKPKFVIKGFLDPRRYPCFCAIDDTLFIFDGNEGLDRVFTDNWNKNFLECYFETLKSERKWKGVYHLKMSDYLSHSQNQKVYIDESSINKSCDMLGDKWTPQSIRYGENKIIVFSTQIIFADPDAWSPSSSVDFELYCPESKGFKRLPCLRVRRIHYGNHLTRFALVGSSDEEEEELEYFDPLYPARGMGNTLMPSDKEAHRLSFSIVAHSLIDEHFLVVQADFGQLFSLDLSSEKSLWQLFKAPLFPCTDRNFVFHQDGDGDSIALSPLGVHKYQIGGRGGEGHGDIDFRLPLSSYVLLNDNTLRSKNYVISVIEETRYITCVGQFGFDSDGFLVWTLDLVHFIPRSRKAVKLESFRFRSRGADMLPLCVFAF